MVFVRLGFVKYVRIEGIREFGGEKRNRRGW